MSRWTHVWIAGWWYGPPVYHAWTRAEGARTETFPGTRQWKRQTTRCGRATWLRASIEEGGTSKGDTLPKWAARLVGRPCRRCYPEGDS